MDAIIGTAVAIWNFIITLMHVWAPYAIPVTVVLSGIALYKAYKSPSSPEK